MSVPAARAHTRHVEECMGTVFTIDVRDPGDWQDAIADAVATLHQVDRVFSTYRPDSYVRRLHRGEVRLDDCPPEVAEVLRRCADAQAATGGYFTALASGRLDPTGLVKGWAIERASRLLSAAGAAHHVVSGGGDMQLVGYAAEGRPWQVGVSDPFRRDRLVTIVSGHDFAVATSGVAERGQHVLDPFTGRPATALASVTVVGPHLTEVDAYATAAFAMGDAARSWLEDLPGHEGFAVTRDGEVWATSGFTGPLGRVDQPGSSRAPVTGG